ncbi:MAG TPA: hypothetical protein VN725_02950 [Rhodanobacteraceae bacterium]|nr:hypothetical protein [Rhodanobacteraceae bacterium]
MPPRRPRPILFWVIAVIIIAAIIVAWIYWASDLGRGVNPRTDVPMTPGYAPATTAGAPPSVPANQATRPAPSTAPGAMSGSTTLPPPGSVAPQSIPRPTGTTTVPASGGSH